MPADIRWHPPVTGTNLTTPHVKYALSSPRVASEAAQCRTGLLVRSQFEKNCFTEMCSGSEAGSHLRLIDFVYHSTLVLRVKEREREEEEPR